MKKLMIAALALTTFCAFADEAKEGELAEQKAPLFFGFGNTGIYSGYQLYGSLVNSEPVWQTYLEADMNVQIKDLYLGYVGLGLWFNSDLTKRRHDLAMGRGFPNEYDPNVHFGRTFWFDDDKTWGLDWRSTVVWFYYPPKNYSGARHIRNHANLNRNCYTTYDFDHSFALLNPYVIPFIDVVHEYKKGANLLQFGLKKPVNVDQIEGLTLVPSITGVWRERQYNWCFPTAFGYADKCNSGVATVKLMLEGNYAINDNFGLFAKVAYCRVVDPDLRHNCDRNLHGNDYGDKKDYVWGGVGVTFAF